MKKQKKTNKKNGTVFVLMFLGLIQMIAAIAIRYYEQISVKTKEDKR